MWSNTKPGNYDLCIIGSGPAGIISALEYSKINPLKRILIVEFGHKKGKKRNRLDDSIVIKNPTNHYFPYECTNKGFGGTSATWGGRCVMYDEIDFINRSIINFESTWDVNLFQELQTYLPKAAQYFECGNPQFDLKETPFSNERIADGFIEGDVSDSILERWSKPTRFGLRYLNELKNNVNVTLLEGYEARDFAPPDRQGKINSLFIRNTFTNEVFEIQAYSFILAAGTQETTRIILRNLQLFKNLREVPNALGRYYQSHLSGKIASVHFYGDPRKTDYGFLRDSDGIYIRRRFQFTRDFLIINNLLNTAIWLDNSLYHDPKHNNGAMSLMYIAMITPFIGSKLAPPAIANSITKGKVQELHKHFYNILKDLPASITTPLSIFFKRYFLDRKLPGVFLYNASNTYALHFHSEQIPIASNRMEIGEDGESLIIHYDISDDDLKSVIAIHEKLDESLRINRCGQLNFWFPKSELAQRIREMSRDGIHQSGTTRIADSPEKGVVDKNLRLFGTSNLFICSSSVFPTSSQANPTFFLGAFAVRLANYLNTI